MRLDIKHTPAMPDVMAPDGSEVRILCATERASMATFTLPPRAISKAVVHRTVDEIWYFLSGRGRMWRRLGDEETVDNVEAGVSVAVPVGTEFQFRADGPDPLVALGATIPPWPEIEEATMIEGIWDAPN